MELLQRSIESFLFIQADAATARLSADGEREGDAGRAAVSAQADIRA